jgi:release factor glutamine methyltransferase
VINRQKRIPVEKLTDLDAAVRRVCNHEPIQYITGEAFFYGRKFLVNSDVLIPRRETEELVQYIIHENQGRRNIKILDIGTGSGCIAITLKKEMEDASVSAIDVSEAALKVAAANAQLHQAIINFCQADICASDFFMRNEQNKLYHFDIIVSNPPYVRNSEAKSMHKNVVEYEPHLALFVTDKDPLIFYRMIISLIQESANTEMDLLKEGGGIFFEVNENLANEVAILLEKNNFKKIRIIQDLQQKNRFVSGKLKVA